MLTLAQLQAMHEADPDAGLLDRFLGYVLRRRLVRRICQFGSGPQL